MIIARTSRLILRKLHGDDCEAMETIFSDSEVMRFSAGTKTPAKVREWVERWIDDLYSQWGFGMWAVVRQSDDLVIGYCGLSRFAGRVAVNETEIGFRLARAYWGAGYATEALLAVRDYAFGILKIPKLVALIDPANVASIRVVEKAGFKYERDAMLEGYDHPDRLYIAIRPLISVSATV
ncbi:MAG TPA: GNAT family N-acetyltransferase [Tepidisphaeraceae bacterium]|jgi:hypothetical protein